MTFDRLHYFPILIIILFPATFILTYIIAVAREDVTPLFPYISDTGTFSPESCIFGQLLNLGAVCMAIVSFIRYLQIRDLVENYRLHERVEKLNWPSCILGVIAALGISIVGNFQEKNALATHLFGAVLAFGVGGVYISIQSYIAFKLQPHLGTTRLNWTRVVLSVLTNVFFILTMVFAVIAVKNSPFGDEPDNTLNMKWKPDQKGWTLHFISALSEWIVAMSLLLFLATFTGDFKKVVITKPTASNRLK